MFTNIWLWLKKKIKRSLKPGEEVHHLDLNRGNNNPENLLVLEKSQHTTLHNWILAGAVMSKDINENGVNSEKAKTKETRYCAAVNCENVVHNPQAIYCCPTCFQLSNRKVERPSKEELESMLGTTTMLALGKHYKVSDVAVRKWAKQYGLSCQH